MIDYISIKDFAIIDNIEVEFGPGLSIITGETGSGKSILITAISLALGSRADSSYVRNGKEKAYVELAGSLPTEDGLDEIVISREINSAGKNLCRINGRVSSLSELQEIALKIADIHGQYDNQSLLNPENHLGVIDSFQSNKITPILNKYRASYENYLAAKKELTDLLNMESENARKADFYKFEIKEIDDASPAIGEDTEVKERLSLLQNSEKIFASAKSAYDLIDGSGGAYTSLGNALSDLERISQYSESIGALLSDTNDVYYHLEDISSKLRSMLEDMTFDPGEIDNLIERLILLDNLKKKYGGSEGSLAAVLEYRNRIEKELSLIENFDSEKARLNEAYLQAESELNTIGSELSKERRDSGEIISQEISKELGELNFTDADLKVEFSPLPQAGINGMETAEFLITTNVGEPHKPLAKTASGGEISRIMLAIKKITAAYDSVPTLIFDEIDQGISGRTAAIVGKKLKEISKDHQVICITHLPQIASKGDNNYRIFKESDQSMTYTHIEKLDSEKQVIEIARLLGGEEITDLALENARELIDSGN